LRLVELEHSWGPHPGEAAVFEVDVVLGMQNVDRQRHVQEHSLGLGILSGEALFERRVEGARHHNLRLCGQTEGCADLGNDAIHAGRCPNGSRVDCVLSGVQLPGGSHCEIHSFVLGSTAAALESILDCQAHTRTSCLRLVASAMATCDREAPA